MNYSVIMSRGNRHRNRSLSPDENVSASSVPVVQETRFFPEQRSHITPSKFFGEVGEDLESWIKNIRKN